MPYIIDGTNNPMFPVIVESATGDSYDVLALQVARHHLEAALDHLRAMARLIEPGGIGTL